MSEHPPSSEFKSEWSDSDQRWFDTLTGRRQSTLDDPETGLVVARLMRETYLREQALEDVAAAEARDPLQTEEASLAADARLLAHLQAKGLVDAPVSQPPAAPSAASTPGKSPVPPRTSSPWWRMWRAISGTDSGQAWPRAGGAFAVVFMMLVAGQWILAPHYPEPPDEIRVRGQTLISRSDVQPRRAAEELLQRLQAGNVRAAVYQRRKTYIVDVTVLARDLPGVQDVLIREGLPAKPGDYRVEYRQP